MVNPEFEQYKLYKKMRHWHGAGGRLFRRDRIRNLVLPETEMANILRIASSETRPIGFHKGQSNEFNTFLKSTTQHSSHLSTQIDNTRYL